MVFSLDNRESFLNLTTWVNEFLTYADVGDEEYFPFVVIGNKVDKEPVRELHLLLCLTLCCTVFDRVTFLKRSVRFQGLKQSSGVRSREGGIVLY